MRHDRSETLLRRFCWVDLATSDEGAAKSFYGRLFGWTVRDRSAGAGRFSTFTQDHAAVASLYQLTRAQIEHGVPSHWTPYVSVADIDAAAARVPGLGGQVVVAPFDVTGMARVSLIADPAGALIGLWEESANASPRDP